MLLLKLRRQILPVAIVWTAIVASSAAAFGQTDIQPYLGSWDVVLASPGGPLRFGLSVSTGGDTASAFLHNGPERIKIPRTFVDGKGALVLDIKHYDSRLHLKRDGDAKRLIGNWKKRRGVDEWVEMEVSATKSSQNPRSKKREFGAFPGKWKVAFSKSADPAVAIFKQDLTTGHIVGTFLTTTGDYRYLDGQMIDGRLELSCFDGAHAFLFHAKATSGDRLEGEFWSSDTWHESWTAVRNDGAKLADAFAQTSLMSQVDLGKFSFPDLDGKPTRLDDPKFIADARIIYVFGSWCPNCHDAGKYFSELEKWYGDKLSIVGLAFEMTGDLERDGQQVREYLKRHDCKYPVLLAGLADKALASKAIPFLDRVRSYPTTLFLDRAGKVMAIHTGFTGPATGEAYLKQKQKFESIIDKILDDAKK